MPLRLILDTLSFLSFGAFLIQHPTSVGHQHLPKIPKQNPMASHRARSVRESRRRTSSCHIDAEMDTVARLPQPYRGNKRIATALLECSLLFRFHDWLLLSSFATALTGKCAIHAQQGPPPGTVKPPNPTHPT